MLQVVTPPDKDGVCVCRLHARHYESEAASRLAEAPGVLGYRCLKLGTADAPLRLRLVMTAACRTAIVRSRSDGRGFEFSGS